MGEDPRPDTRVAELGCALTFGQHEPAPLVAHAQAAESAGFSFALIAARFALPADPGGESRFAWSTLGAVARTTRSLTVGACVTCAAMRVHPAIAAEAAATTAVRMPGRFLLGLIADDQPEML